MPGHCDQNQSDDLAPTVELPSLKGIPRGMPLYKYVKFEDLKRILDGTIRYTQPGAFNDPFEMVPELYVPEGFESKEINFRFSVTAPRRDPTEGTLRDDFTSDNCSDQNSRRILASLNRAIGIVCLSKTGSSLLMWSHYAGSYSGAVVKFDEAHEFFSGHFDVVYSEHRPKVNISSYTDDDDPVPISELCVKSKEWEYEKEVRVVRSLTDCRCVGREKGFPVYVMDIPRECIESITLGERMQVSEQREVWESLKGEEDISLYLDAVSNWGYEFRSEPIKLKGMANPIVSPRTAHIFANQNGTYGEIARWMIENHPLSVMVNDTL